MVYTPYGQNRSEYTPFPKHFDIHVTKISGNGKEASAEVAPS